MHRLRWGSKSWDVKDFQSILKKIELPVVPSQECQTILRTTRLGRHFVLHESLVCAGGERGKDACYGDGGSPLACPIKGDPHRFYQVGIVSWGIECGHDYPGIYVNVPRFRNWIDEQFRENKLESRFYNYTPNFDYRRG